jgi:osmoprotectant transport system substrate-binding protein
MYQAAAQRSVDVISAFSSDGRIAAYDLVVLTDDRVTIPPYDAVLLASRRLSDQEPDVLDTLARLRDQISVERMRTMNLEVDEGGAGPAVVAERFVRELTR